MKGIIGGTCRKYTGEIKVYMGTSSGISLNGLGTCWTEVYPLKYESVYKLINRGASPSYPIMNIASPECTPPVGGGTALAS